MSDDVTKAEPRGSVSDSKAPAGAANGKAAGGATRPAAARRPSAAARITDVPEALAAEQMAAEGPMRNSSPQTAELAADKPCDDCPPAGRDWSAGLGWLMVGAALALAFIGADLASRGAISRRLGAAGWDEPQ